MNYNIWLWSIVLLMYMLDMSTCLVRGSTINAVPGKNVSLNCTVDQLNDQQTVKWWVPNGYISSGKDFLKIFDTLKKFCAIGAGDDHSLFIMIPDNGTIWPSLEEIYECRLVPGNHGENFTTIKSYELQIYQPPECIIIHKDRQAYASCSYKNISEIQVKWIIDNTDDSAEKKEQCQSDKCTLFYPYNPSEFKAQELVCIVTTSERELSRTICPMQNYTKTLPKETTEESPTSTSATSTSPTSTSTSTLPNSTSPTSTLPTSTLPTSASTENSLTNSTKSTPNKGATNTETTSTIMTTTVTTNIENTSTIMTPTVLERLAISSTASTTTGGIAIYLIVIFSGAAIIIVFLIIILYFVRRSFKVKRNSSRKSQSADDNVYVEDDQEKNTQKISMIERHPAQNDNINFEQSPVESEMEENCIYQSADINGDQQNRSIERDNDAIRLNHKDKIQAGHTGTAYVEINEIIDKKNRNKESDRPTTSQTRDKVEASDDLGYMENENEAYQSLDEVNERTRNAGIIREESGRTQATEQNESEKEKHKV